MSYILNALRKSEQQRIQGQPETLENSILETKDFKQKKTSTWLIVLVFVNLVFLGFIIWMINKEDDQRVSASFENSVKIAEKSGYEEKVLEHTLSSVGIETEESNSHVSIADQIEQQKQNFKFVKTEPDKIKFKVKEDKAEDKEKQKQLSPVITLLAEAVKSIKVSEPEEKSMTGNIPFLSELSNEFRRNVPEVDINVFVYTESLNGRFIMLDMNKYVTGQQIKPRMKLKEIRMKSIVVDYKNKVFQIKR